VYWCICGRRRNTWHTRIRVKSVARGRTIMHRVLATRNIMHSTVNLSSRRRSMVRVDWVYTSLGGEKDCPCSEGRRRAMKDVESAGSLSRHYQCCEPEANNQEEHAAKLHLPHMMEIYACGSCLWPRTTQLHWCGVYRACPTSGKIMYHQCRNLLLRYCFIT
jgi:hypothetical protein